MRPVPYTFMATHIAVPIIALVLASSGAFAADMRAECPSIIPANSIKPDRPVAGFVTVPSQMHLEDAGMMAGPPESKTYLMPDKSTKETRTYGFDQGHGERWLWCGYGAVELFRRLDDSATSCIITSRTKKPELFLSAVVQCK